MSRFAVRGETAAIAAVVLITLAGCSTAYRDMPRVNAKVAFAPSRSYQSSFPDLRQSTNGLLAWGRMCRTMLAYGPRGLRLELADAQDQVIASEITAINPPIRRKQRCGFYTIRTSWRVLADQHLHLCAVPHLGSRSESCFGRNGDERH